MADLTYSELARVLGVHPATVSRALTAARARFDPEHPSPEPVNPGHPRLRFREEEVTAWWPHRPRRGAPNSDDQATEMTRAQLARRYGVDHATLIGAMSAAHRRHAAGDTRTPLPPKPVNPDEGRLRFSVAAMDAWWPRRLLRSPAKAVGGDEGDGDQA